MTLSNEERTEIHRAVVDAVGEALRPFALENQKLLRESTAHIVRLTRAEEGYTGKLGQVGANLETINSRLTKIEGWETSLSLTRDRVLEIHQATPEMKGGILEALAMATSLAQKLDAFITSAENDVLGLREAFQTRLGDLLFKLEAFAAWLEGKSEGMKEDIDELKKWRESHPSAPPVVKKSARAEKG